MAGGALRVGVWGSGGPLVVAAHGITSSHIAFELVGAELESDHVLVAGSNRSRSSIRISTARVASWGNPPRPSVCGRGRAAEFEAVDCPEDFPPHAPSATSATTSHVRTMCS